LDQGAFLMARSNYTIAIPQRSFSGGELAPSLHARSDLAKYQSGAKTLRNFFVHAHGGASNRPGTKFIAEVKNSSARVRLIPFQFSVSQTYVLEFGNLYMRVYTDGGQVLLAGVPYEIATPYTTADLPTLKYVQSADVMTIAHPSYATRNLSRTAHTAWTLATITLAPALAAPAGPVATPTNGTGAVPTHVDSYKITAVRSETLEESLPSVAATCTNYPLNPATGTYNTVTWSAVSGATKYNIYKEGNGSGIHGFIGSATALTFTDNNLAGDDSDTPPGARDPFTASNYPGVVTYHQQRRVFGGSTTAPQTVWMSQSGNYQNFNVSSPSRDDDAVTFTLASPQVNEIRHFVPLADLLVLTSGGEFKVTGGGSGGGDAITPSAVVVKPQGYRGSSHVPPLIIGETALFVQQKGAIVRDLGYNLDVDGYAGNDLSVLSNHLFEGLTIDEWAYAQAPHSIVWAVRSDGVLLSLTYMREHQVWAWCQHDTDGTFESVCSVSEGTEDAVYVAVNRTIGNTTTRFVERFQSRIVNDVRDAFFVDCGLTYDGIPATVISGLTHLEGKTVTVLADGSVSPTAVVSGGSITLPHSASVVHVGLGYTSEIKTLDLDLAQARGPANAKRRVTEVVIKVERSRGLWVGPDADHTVEVKQRDVEPYGDPIELFTADIKIAIPPSWGRSGSIVLQQLDPLPLTVLAVLPEVEIGGL
jgi:hypothetical protein